jgi:hypothetical protein
LVLFRQLYTTFCSDLGQKGTAQESQIRKRAVKQSGQLLENRMLADAGDQTKTITAGTKTTAAAL